MPMASLLLIDMDFIALLSGLSLDRLPNGNKPLTDPL